MFNTPRSKQESFNVTFSEYYNIVYIIFIVTTSRKVRIQK